MESLLQSPSNSAEYSQFRTRELSPPGIDQVLLTCRSLRRQWRYTCRFANVFVDPYSFFAVYHIRRHHSPNLILSPVHDINRRPMFYWASSCHLSCLWVRDKSLQSLAITLSAILSYSLRDAARHTIDCSLRTHGAGYGARNDGRIHWLLVSGQVTWWKAR